MHHSIKLAWKPSVGCQNKVKASKGHLWQIGTRNSKSSDLEHPRGISWDQFLWQNFMRKWWLTHWILFVAFGFELKSVQDAIEKRLQPAITVQLRFGFIAHSIVGRPLTRNAVEIEHPKHTVLAQLNWITENCYRPLCDGKERLVNHEDWTISVWVSRVTYM